MERVAEIANILEVVEAFDAFELLEVVESGSYTEEVEREVEVGTTESDWYDDW